MSQHLYNLGCHDLIRHRFQGAVFLLKVIGSKVHKDVHLSMVCFMPYALVFNNYISKFSLLAKPLEMIDAVTGRPLRLAPDKMASVKCDFNNLPANGFVPHYQTTWATAVRVFKEGCLQVVSLWRRSCTESGQPVLWLSDIPHTPQGKSWRRTTPLNIFVMLSKVASSSCSSTTNR